MKYSAIEKSDFIEHHLKRFLKFNFQIQDEELYSKFKKALDEYELKKGPYISVNYPYERGRTVKQLIDTNILSKEFEKMNLFNGNLDSSLFSHQEKSIIKANEGRNLIISTGTGSGKTYSFLLPILNSIAKDIELGLQNRGVQALLLYPMNALINDQREVIRGILKNYPQITFGYFTGETKETEKDALISYRNENKGLNPKSNELISREQIRATPPNILITNYSMLEYLLIRPKDTSLFDSNNTRFWKYIVLDEAHTYKGALGIEISYLLRRLLGNINSNPRFILTSATLAKGENDYPDVVKFAENLTSNKFSVLDIIVSNVIKPDASQARYSIEPSDYALLNRLINDDKHDEYKSLISSYLPDYQLDEDLSINLFELLSKDENYYRFLYNAKSIQVVSKIRSKLGIGWNNEYVSDLINLISKVNFNEKRFLVDIRYHTFMRSLEGAYVTLKPSKNISLSSTKTINGLPAFQLGSCKYCDASYMLGIIKDNHLLQTEEEELYENLDDIHFKNIEIFLIEELAKDFEYDEEIHESWTLCNKCKLITLDENVNKPVCDCGNHYQIKLIKQIESKVKNKKDHFNHRLKNNLYRCLQCESTNNSGVVDSFYLGKDTASALIAQLLYKTLGTDANVLNNQATKVLSKSISLFKPAKTQPKEIVKENKQFIAFSDSRQQASFFAIYFEERNLSFLRKKVLLDTLEKNKGLNLNVLELQSKLKYVFETKDFWPDKDANFDKEAWLSILIELFEVDGKFSLSGLGLMNFVPNIDLFKECISDEELNEYFPNASKDDVLNLIKFIMNQAKRSPAINYFDIAQLSEEDRSLLQYRAYDNVGLVLNHTQIDNKSKYGNVKTLIPKIGENSYTEYIQKAFGVDYEKSKDYLENVYNFLKATNIFVKNPKNDTYLFDIKYYKPEHGDNIEWYQCKKCKSFTNININNKCNKYRCDGKLDKVDPKVENANNYYFTEYQDKKLEKIIIEEHTAQLDSSIAKDYQNRFKNGEINILSSSTTFEMGVDIGNLDTVYMRNVPPTPANYIQRAGRAGRKDTTPAYIITFCGANSHDFSYFTNPDRMIGGSIVPPSFNIQNEKIYNRHILSSALSFFFRLNPELFDSIEDFAFEEGVDDFLKYLENKPSDLIQFVVNNIDSKFEDRYIEWLDNLGNPIESPVLIMQNSLKSEIEQLESMRILSFESGNESTYYRNRINAIKQGRVITNLSEYGVIPRYGFPIDNVKLTIPNKYSYKLERDLSFAISEYAPGSEVIVDKKKYISRYIKTLPNQPLPKTYFVVCDICNNIIADLNKNSTRFEQCEFCKNDNLDKPKESIKPVHGFITENEFDKSRRIKAKKTYSSEVFLIEEGVVTSEPIIINDHIKITSSKRSRLSLINDNPFYFCPTCGYTHLEKEKALGGFISLNKNHRNSRGFDCSNERLNLIALEHDFATDVVSIELLQESIDRDKALSVLYALLEGISDFFEIERFDINGLIQNSSKGIRFILYDNVPGGAGHVSRILNKDVFIQSLHKAMTKVNADCCDLDTSCNNCLRNYYNQKVHVNLKRSKAQEGLLQLLELSNTDSQVKIQFPEDEKFNDTLARLAYLSDIKEVLNFKDEFKQVDYFDVQVTHQEEIINPTFVWVDKKIMFFDVNIGDIASKLQLDGWQVLYSLKKLLEKEV